MSLAEDICDVVAWRKPQPEELIKVGRKYALDL
jgi:hypothetical protein